MKLLQKLDNNLFTAIAILLSSLVAFGITSFLLAGDYRDIPFGFLFAGGIISLLHITSSFLVKIDIKRGSSVFSILSVVMRLVALITALLIDTLMYYRWNIKLFNVFVFIGVYTFSVIIFMIVTILRKNRKE